MKKTFIIVFLLVICLICCSCNSFNGETNISDSKSDSLTSDIVDNLNSSNDTSTEQSIVISTEIPCEHSYGEWKTVTEPTCEVEGKSERVCENCDEKEEKIVDKTEHTWEDATCITAKICSVCKITEGQPISHNWSVATCVNPKTCTMCKATEGTVADHKWQSATCVEAKKCVTCGKTEGEANGHTWKDATCTTAKTCATCKTTSGKALGHKYTSGKCSVCNADDPSFASFQKSFKAVSNYLDEYGYGGQYTKTVNGGTLYFIHTSQDTVVIRFDSNCYKSEYSSFNTLNSGIRIYSDGTIEVFSVIWTKYGVIQSNKWFNVKKNFKASEITKATTIRYNDDTIPTVYQQAIDEFSTEALHLAIKEGNNYFAKAGVNMYSLGFVNY